MNNHTQIQSKITLLIFICLILHLQACSPLYVLDAGWEEAGILWRRKDIEEVINNSTTDVETRRKLELVRATRNFTLTLQLKPNNSFTYYSKIDRKVLVWVLTAAPKISLSPVTWWFPFIGRVPYKGYFERKDGIAAAKKLKADGLDVYLRPSLAFSTLGWFNDPVLSSVLTLPDTTLVETVIHEILHNTIWIPQHVAFNESLANFVGIMGSREFFAQKSFLDEKKRLHIMNSWQNLLVLAQFLDELIAELEVIYAHCNTGTVCENKAYILAAREQIFVNFKARWEHRSKTLLDGRFQKIDALFNNAALIGYRLYITKPRLFDLLYKLSDNSMVEFIKHAQECAKKSKKNNSDPFDEVAYKIQKLCKSTDKLQLRAECESQVIAANLPR